MKTGMWLSAQEVFNAASAAKFSINAMCELISLTRKKRPWWQKLFRVEPEDFKRLRIQMFNDLATVEKLIEGAKAAMDMIPNATMVVASDDLIAINKYLHVPS